MNYIRVEAKIIDAWQTFVVICSQRFASNEARRLRSEGAHFGSYFRKQIVAAANRR